MNEENKQQERNKKAWSIADVVVRYLSRLSMKNTGRCLFVDKVNGREVCLYTDKYGKEWMAQSKWEMRCAR